MGSFLSLDHVSFNYHGLEGETPALEDVSFEIRKGEFAAIVGPSGCGKTTLLSLLAGLEQPDTGSITIQDSGVSTFGTVGTSTGGTTGRAADKTAKKAADRSVSRVNGRAGMQVGYMLQKDQLLEWRTTWSNVLLGPEIQGGIRPEHRERAEELLKLYGLYDFRNSYPSELSGGMRQRAALIRTLMTEPELLLLDEPFSALDYQTRLRVSDDIWRIIKEQKKTAVLITHDIAEAVSMADRVLVLSKRPGKVLRDIPIRFPSLSKRTPFAVRSAVEFQNYFQQIWKEMNQNEDEREEEKQDERKNGRKDERKDGRKNEKKKGNEKRRGEEPK